LTILRELLLHDLEMDIAETVEWPALESACEGSINSKTSLVQKHVILFLRPLLDDEDQEQPISFSSEYELSRQDALEKWARHCYDNDRD
jgi:hypothetical protein